MTDEQIDNLTDVFLALSDKTRLRLLRLMAGQEVSVGYLTEALGESQPKVSRHLAYLRNAGVVSTRRDGKWIYYAIDRSLGPAAAAVIDVAIGSSMRAASPRAEFDPADRPIDISAQADILSAPASNDLDVFLL